MNTGWIGRKGQGKSAMMARELLRVLARNKKWHERLGLPIRKVCVMFGLADWFKEDWAEYLVEWSDIVELPKFKECDVFADDITTRLDQTQWRLLGMDVKEWLRANERHGCDFYFNAQNFAEVEITFRRMTDVVYYCEKVIGSRRPSATRPEVKKVWGIIRTLQIPEDEFRKEGWTQSRLGETNRGRIHWLSRKLTDIYDHTTVLPPPDLPKLKHYVQWCELREDCEVYPHGKTIHV